MGTGPQKVILFLLFLDIDITEEELFLDKAGANPSHSLTHPPKFWPCNWSGWGKRKQNKVWKE